jgi:chromosome segregation ATPase
MKLNELAVANTTKQAAKVFESYFGDRVTFDTIDQTQALKMLRRVRGLVAEHRRTPEFHRSEQNPAYLKLVVMEQALSARIMELDAQPAAPAGQPNPQAMAMQTAQKRKEIDDRIKQLQDQIRSLQQQRNMPAMGMAESRRRISESEVQQAQVVLAAQDMVDEVQKMSEQVSAMQFKDLPALVDQIKNQVGPDQATQFNGDASAALSALLQNLQGSKQQLDQALGVVTGQAPAIPGDDMGADMGADAGLGGEIPAELPAPGEEEIETDVEVDDVDDSNTLATSLGRGRR